jgi:hypothetical protein
MAFRKENIYIYICVCVCVCVGGGGRDSSVGVPTRYRLHDSGIESRLGEIFRTRPDQPWGPLSLLYTYNRHRLSFQRLKQPGRVVDTHLHLAPKLKKE